MTANRLAKSEGPKAGVTKCGSPYLTAAEYAAVAREAGKLDLAKQWDARAAELGEDRIPNGTTVRFRGNGIKERVRFAA